MLNAYVSCHCQDGVQSCLWWEVLTSVGLKSYLPQSMLWGAFQKFVIWSFHREVHENCIISQKNAVLIWKVHHTHSMCGQRDDVFVSCCALAVCQSLSENVVFLLAVSNVLDPQNVVVKWRMTVFRGWHHVMTSVHTSGFKSYMGKKRNDIHTQYFT